MSRKPADMFRRSVNVAISKVPFTYRCTKIIQFARIEKFTEHSQFYSLTQYKIPVLQKGPASDCESLNQWMLFDSNLVSYLVQTFVSFKCYCMLQYLRLLFAEQNLIRLNVQ